MNYLSGGVDGSFGNGTASAVCAFQKEAGLPVTGIADNATQVALYADDAPAAPAESNAVKVTAKALYDAYDKNEFSADNEYKDKVIEVSGKIYSIGTDIWGKPQVLLYADSYGFSTVDCSFSKDQINTLSTLSKEQNVVIRGTCEGMSILSVELSDCEIVY